MTRQDADFDEFCDPNKPRQVEIEAVLEAVERLRGHINYTPCKECHLQKNFRMNLHFKLEILQTTGSFKERGVLNALLQIPPEDRHKGVVMASMGNAGIALAHHGQKLEIPTVVIMPRTVTTSIIQKCRSAGARIVIQGANLMESQKHARAKARETHSIHINGRDHPDILTGYGTLALEILEQVPLVNAVLVPVGCGGMAGAIASVIKQVKPKCLVYGVQAVNMPAFYRSLEKGSPSILPNHKTMANEIGVPHVGVNSFFNGQLYLDKLLLVKENWISRAILHLMENERLVVDGAGACAFAAIIGELVPELRKKNVVCVLSGGNVDISVFPRCLQLGLAAEGRLMKFVVTIRDNAKSRIQLFRLLSFYGYNIIQYYPERVWSHEDTYFLGIRLVCETKNLDHALELKEIIERSYPLNHFFENEPFQDRRSCACYVRKRMLIDKTK